MHSINLNKIIRQDVDYNIVSSIIKNIDDILIDNVWLIVGGVVWNNIGNVINSNSKNQSISFKTKYSILNSLTSQ